MGCRTHLGVAGPGNTYIAAYLQWGDHPVRLIPRLRLAWREQFAGDTAAWSAALLTSGSDDDPLWHGHLHEPVGDIEWLYLIQSERDAVEVHAPTLTGERRLYSRHRLPVRDDDLFHLDGLTVSCTSCAAIDEVEFTTSPTPGPDLLAVVRCTKCGIAETTDSRFITVRAPSH